MRFIDEIIRAVQEHPSISETHKQVLINRIEKPPTRDELLEANTQIRLKEEKERRNEGISKQ